MPPRENFSAVVVGLSVLWNLHDSQEPSPGPGLARPRLILCGVLLLLQRRGVQVLQTEHGWTGRKRSSGTGKRKEEKAATYEKRKQQAEKEKKEREEEVERHR